MYSLDQSQQVEAPLEQVFAFFSNPGNLARITPSWLCFRIHGPSPAALGEGSRIEYRIRWGLFTLRWVTRITRWRPTSEFQDMQEKGPYRTWLHTHRFSRRGSSVIMEDHVDYELPFGVLGRIAHRIRVRAEIEEIFEYRRKAIEQIFGARTATAARRGE